MIGIIDWRVVQCQDLGVTFCYDTWAEADDVMAENPDEVIIATGGLPHTEVLKEGNDLVVSAWDIISGREHPEFGGAPEILDIVAQRMQRYDIPMNFTPWGGR